MSLTRSPTFTDDLQFGTLSPSLIDKTCWPKASYDIFSRDFARGCRNKLNDDTSQSIQRFLEDFYSLQLYQITDFHDVPYAWACECTLTYLCAILRRDGEMHEPQPSYESLVYEQPFYSAISVASSTSKSSSRPSTQPSSAHRNSTTDGGPRSATIS